MDLRQLKMKKLLTFSSWLFNELISQEEYIMLRALMDGECYSQIMRLNKKNLRRELNSLKLHYNDESVDAEVNNV